MRRTLPLLLLSLLSLSPAAQTAKQPLTNADIIEMSREGVPQSTILLAIQNTPAKFDVSPQGLITLHAAGAGHSRVTVAQALIATRHQQTLFVS